VLVERHERIKSDSVTRAQTRLIVPVHERSDEDAIGVLAAHLGKRVLKDLCSKSTPLTVEAHSDHIEVPTGVLGRRENWDADRISVEGAHCDELVIVAEGQGRVRQLP
jgi:hypothetical protein